MTMHCSWEIFDSAAMSECSLGQQQRHVQNKALKDPTKVLNIGHRGNLCMRVAEMIGKSLKMIATSCLWP